MLLHFQEEQFERWWKKYLKKEEQFERWWKKYLKKMDKNNGFGISAKEIKACCKKAYEQGRFDEANYIGACMRDTEEKSRKENRASFNDEEIKQCKILKS